MLFTKRGRSIIRPIFQIVAIVTIVGMLALFSI